jgi:hypothetical protein
MTRILLRSPQYPDTVLRPLESTGRIGTNTGNMIYLYSVHRAVSVPGATVTIGASPTVGAAKLDAFIKKANQRFDRFVLPMANSFRTSFSRKLVLLTRLVRGLDMPVTLVGVGAQAPVGAIDEETGHVRMGRTGSERIGDAEAIERHDAVVRDFVTAVLERSTTIGVRGPITKQYLVSIGIAPDRVDVIGCPSLFMWGPGLTIRQGPPTLSPKAAVSMNIDYRVQGIGDVIEHNMALYPQLTSVAQDSNSARVIITGRDEFDLSKRDLRTPIHTGHELYRDGRLLYFPSAWGWIEWMKRQDFVFGNRLHGNIAALLAGTPAHILVHDTRTLELSQYFGIPHTKLSDLTAPPSAAELYERTDYTRFHELHPQRFQTYLDFMHRNGLTTVFDEGQNADEFDRSIQRARRSGPVRSRSVGAMLARTVFAPSLVRRSVRARLGRR